MTNRDFNKILRTLSIRKGNVSKTKINEAPNELKKQLIAWLVRNRAPILQMLINNETDTAWLSCCGYFYSVNGKAHEFLCTAENRHRITG